MSSTPLESAADASQAPASAAATAPTSVVGTTRRRRGGDSPLLELPDDDGDEDEEGDFGSESSGGSGSGSDDSDDDDGDAANSDEDAELAAPASGVVTKQEPGTNEDAGARSQLKRSRALADDSDDEDGTSATAPIKREPGTERAGAEKKSKKEKKEKKEKKDKKEKKEKKDKKEKADKKKSLSSSSSSEKEKASSKTSKSRTRDASRFLDTVAADDAGSGADEESEDDDQDFAAHGLSDFITADEDDPFAKVRGSGSILSAAARAADEARRARTHAEIEEEFEERDAAKLRAQVDQRFGEDAEEQYQRELESEEQQEAMRKAGGGADMPLPGVGTNVFIVRCNPGKEALAVWELLAKCQELAEESADGEPPVFIQSAYCVPTAKGYVYVEARKRAHVERAVRDIEWLKGWSIKLVPVSELTETLTIRAGAPTTTGVTNQILREGTFVRVKHGVYRDDLGLVVRAIERGAAAVIKLVPRVDLTAAGIKGRTASRVRPEPALFEPERARMLGGDVTRANGKLAFNFASFDGYKSGLYLDGFLYKQFSQTAVVADLSASPPTQSEVDRFFGGPVSSALAKGLEKVDDDSGYDHEGYTPAAKLNKPYLDKEAALLTQAVAAAQRSASSGAAAVSLTAASAADAGTLAPVFSSDAGVTLAASAGAAGSQSVFAPGDRILAVQGDLVGLEGVVASVSDDGKVVRVKAQNVELEDLLDMPVDQIIKRFEVGDRVLIRTGPLAGFSATVTFVDTEAFQLSVVTDVTKESTDVAFEYAVHTVTIQGGVPAQTSLYRVGDLVQMTGYLGYVVASEPYQCRVMDGDGLIHSVPLTAMGPKRLPRFSTAMDSRHVPIHKGDLVIPTTGPGSGKRCVVQHVVHSRLFVTCKDVLANGGVLAVPASSVTAVKDLGPNALPAALAAGAAASTPWIADDEDPSAVGGIMRPSAAPYDPRNDPMRGRFVKITKGSYKGSKARIVDCLPNAYLVELTSRKNKFQLSRDSVVDLSEAEPVAPTRRADLALGQTPMVGMGVTPFLGGQTPHLGARTPAYDGKTPAYAMTPGYATYDDDGAHDDA